MFRRFIEAIHSYGLGLLLAISIGGAFAGYQIHKTQDDYTATTEVFASTSTSGDLGQLAAANAYIQQRIASYIGVVNTPIVLDPVVRALRLPLNSSQLASSVEAQAVPGTVLVDISVTQASARQAQVVADAVARSLTEAVVKLEQPSGQSRTALISFRVVKAATLPTSNATPKSSIAVLGLFLALILGIVHVTLRRATDTRLRSRGDLARMSDLPILSEIEKSHSSSDKGLVASDVPRSSQAEAYRRLRTNLVFVNATRRVRSIVVTSSVAGEGKSSVAANLAIVLAQAGETVVLVEGDLRGPQLAARMGLEPNAGLTDVLIGELLIDEAIQSWGSDGLRVLASGRTPPNPSELLGAASMIKLVQELEAQFRFVIIDSPPLVPVTDAAIISQAVDGVLVVAGSSRVREGQFRDSLAALEAVDAKPLGIVLNLVTPSQKSEPYYAHLPGPQAVSRVDVAPLSGHRA